MPNIFAGVVEGLKTLGELGKAKAKAGQSQIQAQRLEEELKKKTTEKKQVQPQPDNIFKDLISRAQPVVEATKPKPDAVGVFERGTPGARAFESAERVSKEIREKAKEKVAKPLIEGLTEFGKNIFADISRTGGAISSRYGVFATEEDKKRPFTSLKEEPFLSEVTTRGVEKTPLGKVPGAAVAAGFLSESLLPPYGGSFGKARFTRSLAKEGDVAASKLLIQKGLKDVSEEEAEMLARRTAPLTDEKLVEAEVESFTKAKQTPTKKVERPIGAEDPFKGLSDDLRMKIENKTEVTADDARAITKSLEDQGFAVPADRRVFRDELGSAGVLGESTREGAGLPDRIIFRPSKADPTKGTLSRVVKAVPDESFQKPAEKLALKEAISAPKTTIDPFKLAESPDYAKELRTSIGNKGSILAHQEEFYARPERMRDGVFYHFTPDKKLTAEGLFGAAKRFDKQLGPGLYVGQDAQALKNFYGLDIRGGQVVRLQGSPKILDLTDSFKSIDDAYKVAKKEFPKEKYPLGKWVQKQGYDGIKYFDPIATGEEYVVYNAKAFGIKDFYNQATKGIEPPAKLPPARVTEEVAEAGGKERKFARAVKESPETKPELREELKTRDTTYEPIRNVELEEDAARRVKESPAGAVTFVSAGTEATPQQVVTAEHLIRHFQDSARYKEAADIAETIAEKLTRAGQTIQAAKLYAHLRPESILVRAQKLVQQANKGRFRWQKDIKLTEETTKQITDLAKQMNEAVDPALKIEFGNELESILSKIPRPGILRQISMIQTIAQLLNPKTLLTRNPLGNEIFYRLERINKYVTSAVDWARSTLTGSPRTVTFHTVKQGEFWKNWIVGAKSGWRGVSPGGLTTQFDIHAPAFSGKWNPLTYLEKTLSTSLRSFDYASYKRAVNETVGELGWLRARNEGLQGKALKDGASRYATEASENALQIADNYGKYVTFQDDNTISRMLQSGKRALNLGQGFGLGDLVIKYPRTPGALLHRALEYSPAGFLRSLYLIAKPILMKRAVADVREIELSLSRAITGSLGLTGLGYYLADKGIITGEPDPNKRVSGIERAIGAGRYQINLSALTRWVISGFKDEATATQPNDRLYSYDWAQPVAVALSLGANMNEARELTEEKRSRLGPLAGVPGTVESSISGAVETITEQPLLTGLRRLTGGESPVQSALSVIESMPSSFTPTVLNQVRQVKDPVSRETYDPTMLSRMINRVKSRIPVLSEELPPRRDVFGREQPAIENPNLFNIFLNPGFSSTYKPTPAAQLVIEIYNATGETKQLPKIAPRHLTFEGKRVELSGEQVSKFQERIGKATEVLLTKLATNDQFKNAPNSKKADMLSYVLGKLYSAERFLILSPEQRKKLVESMSDDQKASFVKELQAAL